MTSPQNTLCKKVKDLQTENYEILMTETEKDINKWKISCVHGLEE